MSTERILFEGYKSKITTAEESAKLIKDCSVLGVSGFTCIGSIGENPSRARVFTLWRVLGL